MTLVPSPSARFATALAKVDFPAPGRPHVVSKQVRARPSGADAARISEWGSTYSFTKTTKLSMHPRHHKPHCCAHLLTCKLPPSVLVPRASSYAEPLDAQLPERG